MDPQQAKLLFQRYRGGNCTPAEKRLVEEWYADLVETGETDLDEATKQLYKRRIKSGVFNSIKPKVFTLKRLAVAASVALVFTTGVYFLFTKPAKNEQPETLAKSDIESPVTNRARIQLADGSFIYLDSVADGSILSLTNGKIVKSGDGKIAYERNDGQVLPEVYNTLTNPRGSKVIDITLVDGSRVWLNAGSSITYPVVFAGNERKITMDGEAYFEVAPDKAKPFKVSKHSTTVEVLGTHFNVNAFEDESDLKITLLEGRVQVNHLQQILKLAPGEQAAVNTAGVSLNKNINLDAVMAWKNGSFVFAGTGVEDALREMARWYDMEVIYESAPAKSKLYGDISRDVPVSKVLRMLEATGGMHFTIKDKKVYVTK